MYLQVLTLKFFGHFFLAYNFSSLRKTSLHERQEGKRRELEFSFIIIDTNSLLIKFYFIDGTGAANDLFSQPVDR
jgi:hypothetical protein